MDLPREHLRKAVPAVRYEDGVGWEGSEAPRVLEVDVEGGGDEFACSRCACKIGSVGIFADVCQGGERVGEEEAAVVGLGDEVR
jgi:hypothetical protein